MWHWVVAGLGVAGNLLFGIGCVPTAYRAWRDGRTDFPRDNAWLICLACVAMYSYLLATYGFNWLVIPVGVAEIMSYVLVLWQSYFPRSRHNRSLLLYAPEKMFSENPR